MSTFTVRDPYSGDPVELKNRLLPEHIKKKVFFWYDGITSMSSWSCPAVITQVNRQKKKFRICSLDDFREQGQEYSFEIYDGSPFSRQTMRLVDESVVIDYIQKRHKQLIEEAEIAKKRSDSAKKDAADFTVSARELGLELYLEA